MKISQFAKSILPLWRFHLARSRLPRLYELIRNERSSTIANQLPLMDQVWSWRRGFLSKSYVDYDFKHNDYQYYLSDYARFVRTWEINGRYREILADKLLFSLTMKMFEDLVPRTHGIVLKGRVHWLRQDSPLRFGELWPAIADYCRSGLGLVLKPIRGGSGAGLFFLLWKTGKLVMNGNPYGRKEFTKHITQLNDYLIEDLIVQAPYSAEIFADSSNTIRLLTMWDIETGEPFIAATEHRFGTKTSAPVDNWDRGGVSSGINLETGMLGPCIRYGQDGQLVWHERHPDSGALIAGVYIPGWIEIKKKIVEVSTALPFLPYIGWDVLVDSNGGSKIIEGNHRPGVHGLQLHTPLLRDFRIRRFYEQYGVIHPVRESKKMNM